ncbi:MAG: ABC transporter substrate-binding protein [Deltaproteobacteria bacterium]|nr:ABC transporter substrate-binding protein [Deltaproteobacteria bacterium]
MKRVTILSAVVVLFVMVYSVPAIGAEPIRIGSPLLLSGRGAFVGGAEKDTLEMMAAELNKAGGINGRPLEFVYYDTEAKPDAAVLLVKRLIQKEKVTAIIGISTSWTALPVIPIVEKYGIPTIMLASTYQIVNPVRKWVFKIPADDNILVGRMLEIMKAQGIQRIALLSSQDGYGDGGRSELVDQSPGFGIKIVFDDRFTMDDTDVTPIINKIKKTDAQAVVSWSSKRSPVLVTMNYRQLGMELPLFLGSAAMSQAYLDAAGENAAGVKTVALKFYGTEGLPDSDPQKKVILGYQSAFREKYGKETNQFGACAFDAFNLMVGALKKAGDDKKKIREAIEKTQGYVGVNGIFSFSPNDHRGLSRDSMIAYEAGGGKWNLLQ